MAQNTDKRLINPDPEAVRPLINRMKRIEGQARGIQRMLEEGRQCEEVVMQISSMRSALNKVAMSILADHLEQCLLDDETITPKQAVERAKELFLKFT